MSDTEDKKLKIQALLEEYKTVSTEFQQQSQEAMRCLPYAAVLIAVYLGWGITGGTNQANSLQSKIQEYIPYAFVLLCVYFLTIAYIREGLMKYRAYVEK